MITKLLNVDEFVEVNKLQEVTDPVYLSNGKPTKEGLFSNNIFGITPSERSEIFGYIDLGGKFVHPLAYINLLRNCAKKQKFEEIIAGQGSFKFEDGYFIPAKNGDGETGIDFLYKHYNDIKWSESESLQTKERVQFLSQDRDKLFLSKFPVIPPFHRDISSMNAGPMGVHEINDQYKILIQQSKRLKKSRTTLSFMTYNTKARIQMALVELFNYFIFDELVGKRPGSGGKAKGMLKVGLVGKGIDNAVSLVISAPQHLEEKSEDCIVTYRRTGIPLAAMLTLGKPFILQGAVKWFENEFEYSGNKYSIIQPNGDVKIVTLTGNPYDIPYIEKQMKSFTKSPATRFDTIKIPPNKEGYEGDLAIAVNGKIRPMTWTDLFYIIANETCMHKHVSITRYPLEDDKCKFHSKIAFLSTTETIVAEVGGKTYKWYPVVTPNNELAAKRSFIDSLVPSNLHLDKIGGDFDGDKVMVIMAWSDEANQEIEAYIVSTKALVSITGEPIAFTARDFINCMYAMTKPPVGAILTETDNW